MKKVKLFITKEDYEVDDQINDFIEKTGCEIIDVKLNTFLDKFQSKDTVYIAIIILLILIIVWINPRALLIGACFLVFTILYSYLVRNYDNIFLSSLVPVIGFTLSTLSLKLVRNIWEKRYNEK